MPLAEWRAMLIERIENVKMSKYIKYNVEDSGVAYLTFGEEGKPVNTLGVAF